MKSFKHVCIGLTGLLGLTFATTALSGGSSPLPLNANFEKECTSCHVAYRPNFLPKASWQKVMASMDKHFGVDATLSPDDHKEISDWLNTTALEVGEQPPENRPTKAFWFTHQHGPKKIRPEVWRRASVKSPANCDACHVDAAKGDFEEDNIRIPR